MVVYGGFLDNGSVTDELLTFNLEEYEWRKITPKYPIEGFAQGQCATVIPPKKANQNLYNFEKYVKA
jgi:hypothetical protein